MVHTLYNIVSGPMVWISMGVFIGGMLFRMIRMLYLVYRKERFIYSIMSLKYSLQSIFKWLTPFATATMRLHPVMTSVTFPSLTLIRLG